MTFCQVAGPHKGQWRKCWLGTPCKIHWSFLLCSTAQWYKSSSFLFISALFTIIPDLIPLPLCVNGQSPSHHWFESPTNQIYSAGRDHKKIGLFKTSCHTCKTWKQKMSPRYLTSLVNGRTSMETGRAPKMAQSWLKHKRWRKDTRHTWESEDMGCWWRLRL